MTSPAPARGQAPWIPYAQLAWVHIELGRHAAMAKLRSLNPHIGAAYVSEIVSIFGPEPDQARRRVDDLRAIGLPD